MRKTFTKYYTNDPVIEQGFVLLSRKYEVFQERQFIYMLVSAPTLTRSE